MVRLTVTIDEELIGEAKRLSGAKTKRETLEYALREYVRRLRQRQLAARAGTSALRLTHADLRRWREAR